MEVQKNNISNTEQPELHVTKWNSDPLYNCYIKIFIDHITKIQPFSQFPGTFNFHGHPIKQVEIIGVAVKKRVNHQRITYDVDDGTGIIGCTFWITEKINPDEFNFKLGSLLNIKGKLKLFNGTPEVNVSLLRQEEDKNSEALHWLETIYLTKNVYKKKPNCTID